MATTDTKSAKKVLPLVADKSIKVHPMAQYVLPPKTLQRQPDRRRELKQSETKLVEVEPKPDRKSQTLPPVTYWCDEILDVEGPTSSVVAPGASSWYKSKRMLVPIVVVLVVALGNLASQSERIGKSEPLALVGAVSAQVVETEAPASTISNANADDFIASETDDSCRLSSKVKPRTILKSPGKSCMDSFELTRQFLANQQLAPGDLGVWTEVAFVCDAAQAEKPTLWVDPVRIGLATELVPSHCQGNASQLQSGDGKAVGTSLPKQGS